MLLIQKLGNMVITTKNEPAELPTEVAVADAHCYYNYASHLFVFFGVIVLQL